MRTLSSIFPIPKYLTFSAVGLDISDRSIRIIGFDETRHGSEVFIYGEEFIEPGALVQGKIINTDLFKKALYNIKERFNFKFARVSLPEEQVYLFTIEIPKMDPSEIRTSIELQLEDHILISSVEAYMDYDLISQTDKTFILQVAAIPTEVADQYFNVFEELGIIPVSFELESQALARAVVPKNDKNTYMLVDYGNSRTGISFIQDGVVAYTTTVPLGGSDQTVKIQNAKKISYEEAEKLKRTSGLIVVDGENSVYDIILPSVSALRGEVYKHFLYWNTHKEDGQIEHRPINKILLCGGTANLPGLTDYLETSLQMSVEIANAWVNITDFSKYIPPINKEDSLAYATAIGLALGHI